MKNKKMIYLLASALIVAGIFFAIIGFVFGGRPGVVIGSSGITSAHNASTSHSSYTLEKTKLDPFTDFAITVDHTDVHIIESDGYYLEYHLSGSSPAPTYKVANHNFTFKEGGDGVTFINWDFSFLSFNKSYDDYYVNLYIPKDQHYNVVKLHNGSGNITFDTLDADTLKCTSDFGDIEFAELTGGSATISQSTGNLTINKADLDFLDVDNDFGHIIFEEIACKKADFHVSSGDIDLNKADITSLKIKSDFGHVTIGLIDKLKDYDLDLRTDFGNIKLNDAAAYTDEDREEYESKHGNNRKLNIRCDSGDISLNEL